MLGSIVSTSLLFATVWLVPKAYMYFTFLDDRYITQEVLFYTVY